MPSTVIVTRHCLFLRNGNGTASFLHSREGVMQGDPLAMMSFTIGTLLLIKNLKWDIYYLPHPWYAEGSGALGMFAIIDTCFNFSNIPGARACILYQTVQKRTDRESG